MTNHQNDVALSELIGFILLLGLVLIAMSMYTVYVVPVNGREDEITQMSYVESQFTDYKLMVDTLWTSQLINVNGANPMYPVLNVSPMISSTTMKLGTGGTAQLGGSSLALFNPVPSYGTLSINTTGDTFAIDSSSYHNSPDNKGEFPINISALQYSSHNYYWIQQQYTYELGGVFLSQDNGTINRISPLISINNAANNAVTVNIVPVQVFGNQRYSSNGPIRIDTLQRTPSNYNISSSLYRNNQWVNISITTPSNATAAMWLSLFNATAVREQLLPAAYTTGRSYGPGVKTVYINITGTNPTPLVSLYVQRADFDVTLNYVATQST